MVQRAIDDVVTLDELIERYRNERDPVEPSFARAAAVLAWAGDRIDDDTRETLAKEGGFTLRREGIPPELELSPGLVARIQDRSKAGVLITGSDYWAYVARQPGAQDIVPGDKITDAHVGERETVIYFDPYRDHPERVVVPASDLTALMSAALVEIEQASYETERVRALKDDVAFVESERVRALKDDIAAGKLSLRALTEDEYVTIGQSQFYELIGCWGWVLSAPVAIVAGIIVAIIAWNALLFLPVALGGAILGYLAMFGMATVYSWLDVRWLRLGESDNALFAILVFTAPAVSLLFAFLVLSLQ